jgi:hypothetical protein
MLLAGGVGVGAGVLAALGVAAAVAVPIVPAGGSVAVGLADVALLLVEVAVVLFPTLALVAVDVPSEGLMVQAPSGIARRTVATSAMMAVRRAWTCRVSSLFSGCRCAMRVSFRVVFARSRFR